MGKCGFAAMRRRAPLRMKYASRPRLSEYQKRVSYNWLMCHRLICSCDVWRTEKTMETIRKVGVCLGQLKFLCLLKGFGEACGGTLASSERTHSGLFYPRRE